MVHVVLKVHEVGVCAYVGILGRVYHREVLVFYDDWAVCRGQRCKNKRALEDLRGRRMVEVDRVGLEDVGAVDYRAVDVFCRACEH